MTARYMLLIIVQFQEGNYLEVTHDYIYIYIPRWYGFVCKYIYDRLLLKTWYIKKTMTKIIVQWWVMIIKVYLSTRRLTLLKDCQISRHEHAIFVLHGNEYYAISVDQWERSMGQWPLMAITMDRRPEDSHGSQMLIDIYWPTIQFRGVLMSGRQAVFVCLLMQVLRLAN